MTAWPPKHSTFDTVDKLTSGGAARRRLTVKWHDGVCGACNIYTSPQDWPQVECPLCEALIVQCPKCEGADTSVALQTHLECRHHRPLFAPETCPDCGDVESSGWRWECPGCKAILIACRCRLAQLVFEHLNACKVGPEDPVGGEYPWDGRPRTLAPWMYNDEIREMFGVDGAGLVELVHARAVVPADFGPYFKVLDVDKARNVAGAYLDRQREERCRYQEQERRRNAQRKRKCRAHALRAKEIDERIDKALARAKVVDEPMTLEELAWNMAMREPLVFGDGDGEDDDEDRWPDMQDEEDVIQAVERLEDGDPWSFADEALPEGESQLQALYEVGLPQIGPRPDQRKPGPDRRTA